MAPCTLAMLKVLPSASRSLSSKLAWLMVAGVSSSVEATVSLTATGASLTGVTLIVTVLGAVSKLPAESCTLNVKLAYGAPLALRAGANTSRPAAMSAAEIT